MQTPEYLSLSDTRQHCETLQAYIHARNSYEIRNRHYQLDLSRGFTEMARSRELKLNEAQQQLQQLEPQVKQIEATVNANLAADPKNKRARLLQLYFDIINADVYAVAKLQQKITSLRTQVFNSASQPAATAAPHAAKERTSAQPEQMSLFDD
ncbi:MAG: hypothetical protein ACI308_11465 [Muribaculaceae bacterium]